MKRRPVLHILAAALLVALLSGCLCRNRVPNFPPDQLEPNDTPAQATVLTLGSPVQAAINEGDEPDVFRFEAEQGQTIRVHVASLEGGALHLDVLLEGPSDSVTADLPDHFESFPASLAYVVTETGTHFLTLEGDYVGPPDALCIRGRLRYELLVDVVTGAQSAREPVPSEPRHADQAIASWARLAGNADKQWSSVACMSPTNANAWSSPTPSAPGST